jgi:hypothetical protein
VWSGESIEKHGQTNVISQNSDSSANSFPIRHPNCQCNMNGWPLHSNLHRNRCFTNPCVWIQNCRSWTILIGKLHTRKSVVHSPNSIFGALVPSRIGCISNTAKFSRSRSFFRLYLQMWEELLLYPSLFVCYDLQGPKEELYLWFADHSLTFDQFLVKLSNSREILIQATALWNHI